MFPWYQGIQPNFVLPEDDRNGIQQMYGPKVKRTWAKIPNYGPVKTPPTTTTTTTTTTTKRPTYHHNRHHPNHRPEYTPYPRNPGKYYPEKPNYPERPTYPDRPNYPERPNYPTYYPERRHHDTSDEYPKRPHHYPRPTPETTTKTVTYRPHYPTVRPEYPSNPRPKSPYRNVPKPKPHYPDKTTIRPTPPSDKPDTCDTSYDAVALIRGELFIFKNRYHWRIGAQGRYPQYPIEISRMWPGLPSDLTHVDAVYERPDKKIAFFVGRELYLFDSQFLVPGYPRPITHLGLPDSLDKIDAAMVWGHNDKTYFYSGTMYWK
ncbi:unnamed protein product [Diatraea saccharalis]|nr:unnamed protein product [Diatraea saccharalis]